VEWSGVEWSGVAWSGVEWSGRTFCRLLAEQEEVLAASVSRSGAATLEYAVCTGPPHARDRHRQTDVLRRGRWPG
jgi:hypothetical protein